MAALRLAMPPNVRIMPALIVCNLNLLTLLGGCAVPLSSQARDEYILAARYDMGVKHSTVTNRSMEIQRNLHQLKTLGFNTVLFDYLEDAQRSGSLDAAAQVGLRAYLTDRDLHYYLLTGKLRDASSLDTLITTKLKPLAAHSSFAGVAMLSGYSKERASAVTAALKSAGISCLTPGQSGYLLTNGPTVAWIDASDLAGLPSFQIERLLLELNSELYAGWNDGLVIDFALESKIAESPPDPFEGKGRGEVNDVQQLLPSEAESELAPQEILPASNVRSRIFAVESLLRRANLWGARLKGFERVVIPLDGMTRDPALVTALFVRDARRYLFLFNQSSQSVRGPNGFPATLSGKPVVRAVGIPATADRVAGDVFVAHGTELSVNVNLRPGDAALFELF